MHGVDLGQVPPQRSPGAHLDSSHWVDVVRDLKNKSHCKLTQGRDRPLPVRFPLHPALPAPARRQRPLSWPCCSPWWLTRSHESPAAPHWDLSCPVARPSSSFRDPPDAASWVVRTTRPCHVPVGAERVPHSGPARRAQPPLPAPSLVPRTAHSLGPSHSQPCQSSRLSQASFLPDDSRV